MPKPKTLPTLWPVEYKAWYAARRRCHDPEDATYHLYGARGITMAAAWRGSFAAFLVAIGPRPGPQGQRGRRAPYSLDRIDNTKGYVPGNVRWATWREQRLNSTCQPHLLDLTGRRFTRLTALRRLPSTQLPRNYVSRWECRCDCGALVTVALGHLRSGHTRSCGCLQVDVTTTRNLTDNPANHRSRPRPLQR